MNSSSTFRMAPTTKQRIFVVKSNMNMGSRYIQGIIHPKQHDVYETISDSSEVAKNAQFNRLMNVPSNLAPKVSDTLEEQVLNDVVQKVVKSEPYHVLRNQNVQQMGPKRYCTYKAIEDKLQPYVDRLRAEINKRRHRIEIECANDLGLSSPWRRTRYRKAPKMDESGLLNPSTISLSFDSQSDTLPYNKSSYYTPSSRLQLGKSVGNPQIIVGNRSNQQIGTLNDLSNEERSSKRFKTADRCPACDRECRKQLFCLCCSACSQRFHGKCVKMTVKRLSKRETPWLCEDCIKTPPIPKEDLFCLCKKPYNSRQFYVGCDGCDNWYHPACVGTTQEEIESIEGSAYICPNCRNNSIMQNYNQY